MRLRSIFATLLAFVVAGALCLGTAVLAVEFIENRSAAEVARTIRIDGQDWTKVEADGMQVILTGAAPDEATRFRALKLAGEVVDPARVIDRMTVVPADEIDPPEFLIEMLRNGAGISLIGLIPATEDRPALRERIAAIGDAAEVTDLLETADYPEPEGWDAALGFALDALERLPRAKISVSADRVAVTAISESQAEERRIESELSRMAPPTFRLALDVSSPRPVITPFTLRFAIGPEGAKFDACSADTPEARDQIIEAAVAAGLTGKTECVIGLGVPSPRWGEAAAAAIAALGKIGGGSVTFSDADVSLVAIPTTPQGVFDREVGELDAGLPEAFSLHAVLPEPVKVEDAADQGPPEFVATLTPDGQVEMHGRLADELSQTAVESVSHGLFGVDRVHVATRLDPALPDGWSLRVLAGVEALGRLKSGSVVVRPETVELKGLTGNPDAEAGIAKMLAAELGNTDDFAIDVSYREALDPNAALPTPEECAAEIKAAIKEKKIDFDPGSSQIDAASRKTIDRIADVLIDCPDVPMEIGGHTDSQGREVMNQELSQARAEAVLNALMERRILTSNLTARGYGESAPIADNDTAAGRDANRRIEFRLLLPEEEAAATDGAAPVEAAETANDTGAGDAAAETTGAAPEPRPDAAAAPGTGAAASEAAPGEEAPATDEPD